MIKFIYSEKATKFCEIFTLLLSYLVSVKSKVKISQTFVAFSEYMNFTNTGSNHQGQSPGIISSKKCLEHLIIHVNS